MLYFERLQRQVVGLREWWSFAVQSLVQRRLQSLVVHDWKHFRRSLWRRRRMDNLSSQPEFIQGKKEIKESTDNKYWKRTRSLKFWKLVAWNRPRFTDLLFGSTEWLNSQCVIRYCAQSRTFLPLLSRSGLSIFHFSFLQHVAFLIILEVVCDTKRLTEGW